MRLLEHYEILSRSLKETEKEVSITINEISTLLSCSYRNAKIIIHNLQKQKWIEWKPGKGRGNHSTIKLVKSIDQLVLEEAKETITPHSIDESIKLLSKYNIPESLQREFIQWVFHSYLMAHKGEETDSLFRLHFPSYRPLPVLDPALVCRRTENHMMRHIFSQLVRYCEETGEFLPDLAHAWEHNDHQTKWVFYLQKGVRFHHGKEMTAKDVCYSFLRHKNTSSPYSWILEDINQVTAPHPYTVEFRFRKPCSHFLHLVSSLGGSILPKDNASKKAIPIGTGPYKVVANTKEKLTLSVFHEYFLRRPFLEEISLYFFPKLYDNATAIDKLAQPTEMNFYHYPYRGRQVPHFEKYNVVDRGSKILSLNMKKGILADDLYLRKAIFHLLSPDMLMKELGGTRYNKASRLLAKFEEKEIRPVKEIGRKALSKSNYNGKKIVLASYFGAGNEPDAKWIKKKLQKEGIMVDIYFYSYEELHALPLEDVDLLLGEQLSYESDVYTYLSAYKGNHSPLAHHFPINKREETEVEALSFWRSTEEELMQSYGHIHLYRIIQSAFYPSYVKGVHINALGWVDFTKIWYRES